MPRDNNSIHDNQNSEDSSDEDSEDSSDDNSEDSSEDSSDDNSEDSSDDDSLCETYVEPGLKFSIVATKGGVIGAFLGLAVDMIVWVSDAAPLSVSLTVGTTVGGAALGCVAVPLAATAYYAFFANKAEDDESNETETLNINGLRQTV
jgi:hypothetical protein